MKLRLLLALQIIFLLFFNFNAAANTIIVTTNADGGAGSLRAAITQASANGTAISDTIIFNIADNSRSGRTIILNSRLPLLSSNLVIDASTQTGGKFGVTDAKIELLVNVQQYGDFNFFQFNGCSNIEIYGLFFFNEVFTLFSTTAGLINGIVFTTSSNITIGKPGKGNYFRGLKSGISCTSPSTDDYYLPNSADVTIQSNIFGNNESGVPTIVYNTGYINATEYGIRLINTKNIKIGGTTTAEGNTITAYQLFIQSNVATGNGYLTMLNNNMAINTDGTPSTQYGTAKIAVTIHGNYSDRLADYDINISNNRVSGTFEIVYISKYLKMQGNKIFSYVVSASSDYNTKLVISSCVGGGVIGGELPEEQNEIYTNGNMMSNYGWSNISTGAMWVSYSNKILIKKNTTHCTANYGAGIIVQSSGQPFVRIDSTAAGFVKGRATPNANIEVFLDDDCWACDGVAYLGKTTANSDSSWSFNGTFNGVVIATATKDSATSGYTEPTYRLDSLKIKYPTCGLSNGSITGVKLLYSWDNVEWHKTFTRNGYSIDTIISRQIDLVNVPEGYYYFVAKLGESCHSAAYGVNIRNYTPKIDEANLFITNPSCGKPNGAINSMKVTDGDFSAWQWVNSAGVVFPSNNYSTTSSVGNLPPGSYRFIVTDTAAGCADTSTWHILVNQNGPSLNTDNVIIKSATCANADGSVTGITSTNVTGIPFIRWVDSLNHPVGTSLDLVNVPAGKYKLQFKDQGGCDTITTAFFVVPGIGAISIDATNKIIHAAGCTVNNGSVSNIKVTGASLYQWQNTTTNTPAGSTIDINTLSAGNYQLTASNGLGCSKVLPIVIVPLSIFTPIAVVDTQINNVTCDKTNGSITAVSFSNDQSLFTFTWVDSTDNHLIGTGTAITNLAAGTYILIAKDTNGCQQQIYKQRLAIFNKPVVDISAMVIGGDECSLHQGTITGIKVTGLVGPTAYTWVDQSNNTVAGGINLKNVGAGQFQLTVNDAGNCTVQSPWVTIANSNNLLNLPVYKEQVIIRNTSTVLSVANFEPGTYILYNDASGTTELQRNTTGIFIIPNIAADAIFYIKRVAATCSSNFAAVKVTVVDKSSIFVPNAFSPNNDGKNDLFKPVIYGLVKLDYFVVYNRYGQIAFKATDVNTGWDGRYQGKQMETGSYIWMIKATDVLTGKVLDQKGTVTIIR